MVKNYRSTTFGIKYDAKDMFVKYVSKHEDRSYIMKIKNLYTLTIFILDLINRTYYNHKGTHWTMKLVLSPYYLIIFQPAHS